MNREKIADWIWMPFGVWSGVGRGDGVEIVGGKRLAYFRHKCGASHCNQWELCGVVILCREGWRRGSSQITLRFLVVKDEGLLKVTSLALEK